MTQEEKAKAYDKAVEIAKSLLSGNQLGNAWIYKLLPELKESEDERIWTINYLNNRKLNSSIIEEKESLKKAIAWLEKQGEKIDAIENFDTEFEKQVSCLIASSINKEHEYNEDFVKWVANALLNYAKHELEKQNEQKPTDKVEPKFTNNGDTKIKFDYTTPNPEFFQWIYDRLKYIHNENPNVDYMLSLKERIEDMQKTAWSEEDEETLDYIIDYIENNKSHDKIYTKKTEILEGMIEWLKSIKERMKGE